MGKDICKILSQIISASFACFVQNCFAALLHSRRRRECYLSSDIRSFPNYFYEELIRDQELISKLWFKIKRRLGTLNPPHTHTWRRLNYYLSKELIEFKSNPNKGKQAGVELCQSRVILEVIFKVVVKVKS